ncbi:hypothetical protein [Maridesulfovibrio frigidus]|uniref:hypothetical protein n=1 Tax=Maridesulfovibrio frigidus TaxID=340956 RepID=UPI0004E268FA|nr:hypothetical protein [Maridesulfovibrio frigidus]
MKILRVQLIPQIRNGLLLSFISILLSGCAMFGGSIDHAIELTNEKEYEKAVQYLSGIIDSGATPLTKAEAFMLRGENYTSLREYRYAYRDLQVAWKASCEIYQSTPISETPPSGNSTKSFSSAKACTETVPFLIDELKPFTSDFAAIMATQDASSLTKKHFPEFSK